MNFDILGTENDVILVVCTIVSSSIIDTIRTTAESKDAQSCKAPGLTDV